MGVKSLKQLIKSKDESLFKTVDLSEYAGKIIAIDASIYLYKFKIFFGDKFIDIFVKQILRLYKNNILPVYIFDGKPPEEKNGVLKERYEEKMKKKNKIKELKNKGEDITDSENNELIKLERNLVYITKSDTANCKKLLTLMGVPYIVANGEAEALCVKLTKNGLAEGCLSEDTDVLANGGKIFMRNFSVTRNNVVVCYYDEVLKKLEVNDEQFIDICILCGCDYTEKITGIGHVNAYNLIKKYGNIEGVIENCCNIIGEESESDLDSDSDSDKKKTKVKTKKKKYNIDYKSF